MELDQHQKEDFMSYWGHCPLVDAKGDVCFVDGIDNLGQKNQTIFGSSFVREKLASGEWRKDAAGNLKLITIPWSCTKFEELTPVFVDPGYYQIGSDTAAFITRRPERGMLKGMGRSNTSFIGIHAFKESMKETPIYNMDFDLRSIARIYYKAIDYVDNLNERLEKNLGKKFSYALSKNIAVVAHNDYDIPVVMYKLTPVGYYLDNRVLLSKKKDVSKETIEEEAKLSVEIYEE